MVMKRRTVRRVSRSDAGRPGSGQGGAQRGESTRTERAGGAAGVRERGGVSATGRGESGKSSRTGGAPSGQRRGGPVAGGRGRRGKEDAKPSRTIRGQVETTDSGARTGFRTSRRAEETTSGNAEYVSGRRAVLEALRGGRPINKLLIQEHAEGGSLKEIVAVARASGLVIQQSPRAKLDEIAGNKGHQGVVAYIAAKPYVEMEDLMDIARRQSPGLLVILDGVEDPHNLGAVLRAADGAGAAGVIIPKRRAAPLTGTVARISAGALEHVPVARVANISQAIEQLKKAGFWVIGASPDAKQDYWEVDLTEPTAIVIGGEGEGMSRLTAQRCDRLVRLPMRGQTASLNASVTAGVLLYEVLRQRAKR